MAKTRKKDPHHRIISRAALWFALEIIGGTLVLALLLAGGLIFAIQRSPLSLEPLRSAIAREIALILPDSQVQIASASLGWSVENRAFLVILDEVEIRSESETRQVSSLTINRLNALVDVRQVFSLRFAPREVRLSQIVLQLAIDADGAIGLAFGGDAQAPADEPEGRRNVLAAALVDHLVLPDGEEAPFLQALDVVSVEHARIEILPDDGAALWRADDVSVRFARDEGRLQVSLEGREEDLPIRLDGALAPYDDAFQLDARVQNLPFSLLTSFFPGLEDFLRLDMYGGGDVSLTMTREGYPLMAHIALHSAQGSAVLPALAREPQGFRDLKLDASLDVENRLINITRLTYQLDGQIQPPLMRGRVEYDLGDKGQITTLAINARGQNLYAELPNAAEGGIPIDAASVQARLELEQDLLHIDRLEFASWGGVVRLSGTMRAGSGGLSDLVLDARLANLPLIYLPRLFSPSQSPNGHSWISRNVAGGRITEGIFHTELKAGGITGLSFAFDDADFIYAPGMKPMESGAGRCTLRGQRFFCSLEDGKLAAGAIDFRSGSLDIPDIAANEDARFALAQFSADGPLGDLLDWFSPPISFLLGGGKLPDWLIRASGGGTLNGTITIPLRAGVGYGDLGIEFDGQFRAAALERIGPLPASVSLSESEGVFAIKNGWLDVSGKGQFAGMASDFFWRQNIFAPLAKPAKEGEEYAFFKLNGDAPPDEWGLAGGFLPVQVEGGLALEGSIGAGADGSNIFRFTADLESMRFTQPEFGWTKARGEEGKMSAVLEMSEDSVQVREAELVAPELVLTGALALKADGTLTRGDWKAEANRGERVVLRIREDAGHDALQVNFAASTIDLRRIISQTISLPEFEEEDNRALILTLEADSAQAHGGVQLSGSRFAMRREEGIITWLAFAGKMTEGDEEASLSAALNTGEDKGVRLLNVSSANAGLVARGLNSGLDMREGQLALNVLFPAEPDAPLAGSLQVKAFRLANAPVFAQILSAAALTDLVNVLSGRGIYFSSLVAPFTISGQHVQFGDSSMTGASLGLFFSGAYGRQDRSLALAGTLTPLYGLNAALYYLPFVGPLLAGEKGEGVLGITFQVAGELDRPAVTINPGSVLMPGIMRDLFGVNRPSPPPSSPP